MVRHPITIRETKLAVEILNLLDQHRIDDLIVVNENNEPVGIVDSQDLTKLKLL
jgi:arabinose-5-phosphate isomerase